MQLDLFQALTTVLIAFLALNTYVLQRKIRRANADMRDLKISRDQLQEEQHRARTMLDLAHKSNKPPSEIIDVGLRAAAILTCSRAAALLPLSDPGASSALSKESTKLTLGALLPIYRFSLDEGESKAVRQLCERLEQYRQQIQDGEPKVLNERGGAGVSNYLIIPITEEDRVVAIAGVTVKSTAYESTDVTELSSVMGRVWLLLRRAAVEKLLQQSETRLRTIIENMRDIVVTCRHNGTISYVSPNITQLGYVPAALYGRSFLELVHEADRASFLEAQSMLKSHPEFFCTFRVFTKSGRIHTVEEIGRLVSPDYGEADGAVVAVLRDISDQKRAEELLVAKEAAEAASLAKSQFLANVSHEIRTPMNAISGFTDLLARSTLSDKQNTYVKTIRGAAGRLMALLDDILDFAKMEAGRFELHPSTFEFRALVNEAVALFAAKAAEKGLVLETEIAAFPPIALQGDGERLRQIMQNLISNAVKFTTRGKVVVRAASQEVVFGYHYLSFEVEDTGSGVPPNKEKLLFQKFSQVDASTTKQFPGTGLGLAICKQLIELLDGDIHYRPGACGGAVFMFGVTLPAHLDSLRTTPAPATHEDPLSRLKNERPRILLVEDDPESQALMRALLAEITEVTLAGDGEEALRICSEQAFDIILMDCSMPRMDGYEATRRIRTTEGSANRQALIVGVSALTGEKSRAACNAAGMNEFFAKPIDIVKFHTFLANAWISFAGKRHVA